VIKFPFATNRQREHPELANQCGENEGMPSENSNGGGVSGGYDPSFFGTIAALEDRHFWFRGRNRLIFGLCRKVSAQLKPGALVLEVGCGTGNVLRVLQEAFPSGVVVGLELWLDGLRYAQRRSTGLLVQGDLRNSPFGRQFDLIGLFDVLEHIQEERETLLSLRESLVPGGFLLLTVPAHQYLWSHFDVAAQHCRRYSTLEIREKMVQAGFKVDFISQSMACIFPLVWIFRKLRRFRKQSDLRAVKALTEEEFRVIPIINGILSALLNLEAWWLSAGLRLPIGTSLVLVCRRPT
jgi:SAM-dependent methyltransferase